MGTAQKLGAKWGNIRGQATLVVALMLSTFIFLFAFVVNTGVLVNAKINLQNAADLAAYAGAAVQARQLNQVALLNYEMRRRFKRFLFRYNVVGSRGQDTHPGNIPSTPLTGQRKWGPRSTSAWDTPAVCIQVNNPNDAYCRVDSIAAANVPPPSLDPIQTSLRDTIKEIEKFRRSNCGYISFVNYITLMTWLGNTDLSLNSSSMLSTLASAPGGDATRVLGMIRTLGIGLGLLPSEILLSYRINTLEGYLNRKPYAAVSHPMIERMRQSRSAPRDERTIQAYLSAYNTLGNYIFDDPSKIVMSEVMRPTSEESRLIRFEPIRADFDTYAEYLQGPPSPPASPSDGTCLAQLLHVPLQKVPVGFTKNSSAPAAQVFYAIRLSAPAKLLFSPFGPVELTAYAAAKPFGSRIGPDLTGESFTRPSSVPGNLIFGSAGNTTLNQRFNKVPNLPVFASDNGGGRGTGFDNNAVIRELEQATRVPGGGTSSIRYQDIWSAAHYAMAPNVAEIGQYNIPVDTESLSGSAPDPYVRNFDGTGMLSIWAPIVDESEGAPVNISEKVKNTVTEMFAASASAGAVPTGAAGAQIGDPEGFKKMLIDGITAYIDRLRAGPNGEYADGFWVARIPDPYQIPDPSYGMMSGSGAGSPPVPVVTRNPTPKMIVTDRKETRTSWAPDKFSNSASPFNADGRTGYSVKFVPLSQLKADGILDLRDPTEVDGIQH